MKQIVEVVWEDAWSSDDVWSTEELERKGPFMLTSVGYFLADDKKRLYLSAERKVGEDRNRHIIVIPKSLVRSRKKLR